ncbi:PepSY domain-containing protein [Bacillus sp. Cr_A10]|uniref:PepSY domain-containing protein n=1 Tax=Bacillus sp. Cr_A10 TaxID=3033993 RepID=UPI0023DB7DE5|nr:PepSY domain-containing protein [Bacillus sp. Cr_A10]MDF2067764.1 PepSY domain-containing protein [Bacillus sp. Cr_A10]
MKTKKWVWVSGAILLVSLLLIVWFQWLSPSISAQGLSEEEANAVAIDQYAGDIIRTTKTHDEYQIEMQIENGIYNIKIDAKSGNILSLKQLEKAKEQPVEPKEPPTNTEDGSQSESNDPTTQDPAPKENTVITEQEALDIAAKHVNGLADDDTELHQPPDQAPYYLVEVEIENGEEDREAIVQVDAYTGEVKSVNWED